MKPVRIAGFLGENNRLPAYKLHGEDTAFLRHAVNVDLTAAGTIQRRKGVTRVVPGANCHSFFGAGTYGYYVDGSTLYFVDAKLSPTPVLTGLPPGASFSFAKVGEEVFGSNGHNIWRLARAAAAISGIVPPALQPTLTPVGGGSFPAGLYQVAIAYRAPDGEESGATMPVQVFVPGGALQISGIPAQAGMDTAVYVSTANGGVLFLAALTSGGMITLSAPPSDQGEPCYTSLMSVLPPGHIIRYLNGVLMSAAGNFLNYSEPFALGRYDPRRNYIAFPEPITAVAPCVDGVYISADKVYWAAGPLAAAELVPVSDSRAVLGTDRAVDGTDTVFWMSETGMVVGDKTGKVVNVQEKNVAVGAAAAGATLLRKQDGMKQMVASLFSPQQTVMAASSYMDAEVIRKETNL